MKAQKTPIHAMATSRAQYRQQAHNKHKLWPHRPITKKSGRRPMVDNNDSLYREIDEEVRREQYAKFWKTYGNYILGAAFVIVAIVGGMKLYETRKLAADQAAGASFEQATALVSAGKADEAKAALQKIAESGHEGYAALALLTEATSQMKAGKNAEAVATFDKLAGNPNADKLLTGFASLQAAALRLAEADLAEMQRRLTPLMAPESAWHTSAREYLGAAAIRAKNYPEARAILSPLLSDQTIAESAMERVRRMMDTVAKAELAANAAKPAAAATPAAPPTAAPSEPTKPAEAPK